MQRTNHMVSGRLGLSARITLTILVILAASIATCFTIVYRNVAAVTGDAALREVEQSNLAVKRGSRPSSRGTFRSPATWRHRPAPWSTPA